MIRQPSLVARLDWLAAIVLTFPEPFVMPVLLLSSPCPNLGLAAGLISFLQLAMMIAFSFLLASAVDAIRGWAGPTSRPLPEEALERLAAAQVGNGLPLQLIQHMEVIDSDLSIGAHVRGGLRPRVIVSGGMLIGLLRKDARAQALLCHEAAHILHWDRIFPALIGLALFEGIGRVVQFAMGAEFVNTSSAALGIAALVLYQIVIFGTLILSVSRYREYYADAKAVALGADKAAYLTVMQTASLHQANSRFSYFHPSLSSRVMQISKGFPILHSVWYWRIYLLLNFVISWFQWWMSRIMDAPGLSSHMLYFHASMIVSGVLLCCEVLRGVLLSSSDAFVGAISSIFAAIKPGPRALRYGGLVLGFSLVAIAASLNPSHESIILSVGGAIVYAMFRWLK